MIHRAPFRRAALACLAAAALLPALAAAAPDPEKLEQFYEDTEVLRRICYDQGYRAIGSFDELRQMEPKDAIVVFLGSSGIERIPGGLNSFVQRGGAVMIATSNHISSEDVRQEIEKLTGLSVSVGRRITYPLFLPDLPPRPCYQAKAHCPFVLPVADLESPFDKLFTSPGRTNDLLQRIATNEPSFLTSSGNWSLPDRQTRALAFFPAQGVVEGIPVLLPDEVRFALGTVLDETDRRKEPGRCLLLANHRLFLNRMMLPLDTDNIVFAQNCLSFLEKRNDGERRKKLLFVQYGVVRTKFDIPLQDLPNLPDNLGEMVLDGLLRLGQQLPRLQEKLAEVEEKDSLHRGLWRILESKGISSSDVMRWLLLTASGLFALYGLFRISGPGRHRFDSAAPVLPRAGAEPLSQGPLLERRRREMLDNDNLWEAARDRARLMLRAAGVPEPGSSSATPTVQVRGSWWRRWRLRRRALRLWRLAWSPMPQLVPRTAWDLIDRELAELQAALARGDVRFDV